jgi:hypothetical protein
VSFITNQWVKMNPTEAATRFVELERENAALRQDKERLDWLHLTADGINWQTDNTRLITRDTIDAARKEGGAT